MDVLLLVVPSLYASLSCVVKLTCELHGLVTKSIGAEVDLCRGGSTGTKQSIPFQQRLWPSKVRTHGKYDNDRTKNVSLLHKPSNMYYTVGNANAKEAVSLRQVPVTRCSRAAVSESDTDWLVYRTPHA
eukprot:825457-Amphidinium_carterae.2